MFYVKLTPMKLLLYRYTSGFFVIWQKFKSHPCLVYSKRLEAGLFYRQTRRGAGPAPSILFHENENCCKYYSFSL